MAQITLNIPDAQLPRIIAALCDIPRPKLDPTGPNAKAVLVNWVKERVSDFEHRAAMDNVQIDVSDVVA